MSIDSSASFETKFDKKLIEGIVERGNTYAEIWESFRDGLKGALQEFNRKIEVSRCDKPDCPRIHGL